MKKYILCIKTKLIFDFLFTSNMCREKKISIRFLFFLLEDNLNVFFISFIRLLFYLACIWFDFSLDFSRPKFIVENTQRGRI